jgi:hypothetical protein
VDGVSLIVRPVGGSPIQTWHSFGQGKLLTVTPRAPLVPDTTYEVLLTSGNSGRRRQRHGALHFPLLNGQRPDGGNQPPSIDPISVAPTVAPGVQRPDISWSGSDMDGQR